MIPVARPIEDVIADLRKLLVRKLPGSNAVAASWSVVNQAGELIESAKRVFIEDTEERNIPVLRDKTAKFLRDAYVWKTHGEYYAACRRIHAIADAFHVESVTWREVQTVDDITKEDLPEVRIPVLPDEPSGTDL